MRLGREVPRVYTPPLRELTPQTSLGFAMVYFAENVLGVTLLPWQRWLSIHALELLPDGRLRFRTILVLVARQNGKSTWAKVLVLFLLMVRQVRLVLGTAQDLDLAEDLWDETLDLLYDGDDDEPGELEDLVARVQRVNGKKQFTLALPWRPTYKVRAANRRGGRGKTAGAVLLDELREHQTWDAWGAITKTTLTKEEALVVCLTNAGDATSVVLRHLRMMAHAAIGDPDGICEAEAAPVVPHARDDEDDDLAVEVDEDALDEDDMFIAEWSAPPGTDRWNRDGWAQANPSMNHRHPDGTAALPEKNIASAARKDPDHVFFPENMCQWWAGAAAGPFPGSTWEQGTDAESRVENPLSVTYGVDTSWDRTMTYVAIAGRRDDGAGHVEVVAQRAGIEWVREWVLARAGAERPIRLAYQKRGAPASGIADLFTDRDDDTDDQREALQWVELVPIEGAELGIACGRLYDAVAAADWSLDPDAEVREPPGRVFHRPQPVLDLAAGTAHVKPAGDAYLWDRRKSPNDVAPLCAVTWALDALLTQPEVYRSAYEDAGLVVA